MTKKWARLSSALFGDKRAAAQQKQTDRDALLARVQRLEHFVWLLNRPPAAKPPPLVRTGAVAAEDELLVRRVMQSYQMAASAFRPTDGFWDVWHQTIKRPIHDALVGNDFDAAAAVLRDPASNVFFWGFDAIASSPAGEPEPHELVLRRLNDSVPWQELYGYWLCDGLVSLAEVIGGQRAAYPEIDMVAEFAGPEQEFEVDSILDSIEAALRIPLRFPNPFAGELGLPSRRGVVGFRSIQSLYQAWRIASVARGRENFSVLEIGAGLGRTAYFAHQMGIRNYTIIDVPLTNAAQAYFLGRALGPEAVQLGGEQRPAAVRILSSEDMGALAPQYNLVINVDSWTEMQPQVALKYWQWARRATRTVLSINHEHNPHTVRDLYEGDPSVSVQRHPYPMRRGYVEEWITW